MDNEINVGNTQFHMEDGIIIASHKPNTKKTLTDAQNEIAALKQKWPNQKFIFLSDITNVISVSHEAREYYSQNGELFQAHAALVTNPVAKVLGNFFITIHKQSAPIKLFTRKDDAIAWLKSFQ